VSLKRIVIHLDDLNIILVPRRETEVEDPIEPSSTEEDDVCV
jgi:hypothetical protein